MLHEPAIGSGQEIPVVHAGEEPLGRFPGFRTVAWSRWNSSSSFVRDVDVSISASTLAHRMEWMSTV